MTPTVVTFGCRLNAYESEVIRDNAVKAGRENVIVFNTCAVTAEAERQARQAIRKARRERPDATIIVTGCSAQVNAAAYAAMPEVDRVLGNSEKLDARHYAWEPDSEKAQVNDIMSVTETASHLVTAFDGKTRAFVQVQNGCDHRCTFCIIPFGRGNSRSVPVGEIVAQVRALVEQGFREVVLTGVDITSYGKDLPGEPTLGQMMRRLLALTPELPRLRLSSIDAVEADPDLFRLLAEEPRLMPHLHLSLQAGDDMILKRMKRRHTRGDALAFMAKVRDLRPDVVFGADIIAGFPTETEEMFAQSLRLVEEANIVHLHVFPYSERPGTPAARMPQVAKATRKARAGRLREAGERQLAQYLQAQVGKTVPVLMESDTLGRTAQFAEVRTREARAGEVAPLTLTAVENGALVGSA